MGRVSVRQGNAAPKQRWPEGHRTRGHLFPWGEDYCLKKIGRVIVVAIGCPSFVAGAQGRHGFSGGDGGAVQGGVQGLNDVGVGHLSGLGDGELDEDLAFDAIGLGGFRVGHLSGDELHHLGGATGELGRNHFGGGV